MKNWKYIFKPSFWIMNYSYNKEVDRLMLSLLSKYSFTDFDGYTAMLGDVEIWTTNYPYSSMYPRSVTNARASRSTIELAKIKLIEAQLKQFK
jgi:hypothetical protein